jgi:hypothetical protein
LIVDVQHRIARDAEVFSERARTGQLGARRQLAGQDGLLHQPQRLPVDRLGGCAIEPRGEPIRQDHSVQVVLSGIMKWFHIVEP